MINMFGQIPGMQDQMQKAIDMARAQQAKKRSLIGGGEGNRGIASVTADNQVGSLAEGTLGAGGFAVAPAASAAPATPELTAEPLPAASEALATAAITPDPYNNAIRTPQQDAIGQIQGNAFMRNRSLYI